MPVPLPAERVRLPAFGATNQLLADPGPFGRDGNHVARFFVPPVSWLMTSRSRTLHDLVRAAATRYQVAYVSLFLEPETDPFVTDPHLTAADGLHPSDAGYLVWYRELLAQTDFGNRLSISRDS